MPGGALHPADRPRGGPVTSPAPRFAPRGLPPRGGLPPWADGSMPEGGGTSWRHPAAGDPGSIRAPARAHRVLDAGRRGPAERRCSRQCQADGHAGHRDDRPRQHVTAPTTSTRRRPRPGSSRSSASRPTSRPSTAATSSRSGGAPRRRRTTTSPARGAYTHMTMLRRDHRGHAQPVQAVLPGLASRATSASRGWTASCSSRYAKGIIATTGCPGGEVQTRLRLGQYDEALARRPPPTATSSARTTSSSS